MCPRDYQQLTLPKTPTGEYTSCLSAPGFSPFFPLLNKDAWPCLPKFLLQVHPLHRCPRVLFVLTFPAHGILFWFSSSQEDTVALRPTQSPGLFFPLPCMPRTIGTSSLYVAIWLFFRFPPPAELLFFPTCFDLTPPIRGPCARR